MNKPINISHVEHSPVVIGPIDKQRPMVELRLANHSSNSSSVSLLLGQVTGVMMEQNRTANLSVKSWSRGKSVSQLISSPPKVINVTDKLPPDVSDSFSDCSCRSLHPLIARSNDFLHKYNPPNHTLRLD